VPKALAGALVRVFAVFDDRGHLISGSDLAELVPCASPANPVGGRCSQSLLQLAELRSGSDGKFLLLLPQSLKD